MSPRTQSLNLMMRLLNVVAHIFLGTFCLVFLIYIVACLLASIITLGKLSDPGAEDYIAIIVCGLFSAVVLVANYYVWLEVCISLWELVGTKQQRIAEEYDVVEPKPVDDLREVGEIEGIEFLDLVAELERYFPHLHIVFSEKKGGKVLVEINRIGANDSPSDDESDNSNDEDDIFAGGSGYPIGEVSERIKKEFDGMIRHINALLTDIDHGTAELHAGEVDFESSMATIEDAPESTEVDDYMESSDGTNDDSDGGAELK